MCVEGRAVGGTPMRTCVGCRSQAVKSALLRVVAVDSGSVIELVPDSDGRLPGRGAYLHPNPGCLDLAQRRRAFSRALRREGPLDLRALQRWFDEQGIAAANRGGPTGQEKGEPT